MAWSSQVETMREETVARQAIIAKDIHSLSSVSISV